MCIFSHLAVAADISTLQTALSLVRENMEKAKDKHDAKTKAVTQQQGIVAERKKQLADESRQLEQMQKETKQAWEEYLDAQKKYEKAQANLDSAWGKK
jgi:chromosome segregation ATPase